jgi:hypothetical protein
MEVEGVMVIKRAVAALAVLALLTGCGPIQSPPPAQPEHSSESFTFVIETFGVDLLPVAHRVNLTISVFGVDGKLAHKVDPSNGLEQRGSDTPIEMEAIKTPFRYTVHGGPDISGASLAVQFIGREFQAVECRVEVDGVMVPGSASRARIEGPTVIQVDDFRTGIVFVNCVHLL